MIIQNMALILWWSLAAFNLLLLPYTAHKTGFRWWAYLIWGVLLGAVGHFASGVGLAVVAAFTAIDLDTAFFRTWFVVNTIAVLFVCLRLATTKNGMR